MLSKPSEAIAAFATEAQSFGVESVAARKLGRFVNDSKEIASIVSTALTQTAFLDSKTLKDRIDNCIKFKFYLHEIIKTNSNPSLISAVRALKGKNVVCWCSNGTTSTSEGARYCHGFILLSACDYLNQ